MNRIPLAACDHNYSRRREARIRLLPLAAALLCCASSFDARAAGALPAGGQFVGGNGSISGNGTTLDSHVPTPVVGLSSGVTAIATGYGHACAIVHGAAWCC